MKSILREKYRYIAFKAVSSRTYERNEFESKLRQELIGLLGEIDYSVVLPKIIFYENGKGMLKVLRQGLDKTKAALSLVDSFGEEKMHLIPIFVSGTIQGCKKGMDKKKA